MATPTAESAPADVEFSFEFDEKFIRDAIKRDFLWRIGIALVIVLAALAVLSWSMGSPPWEMPMLAGLIAGAIAGMIVAFWKLRQAAKRTFAMWERLSPDRQIRYRLHRDAIEVEMPNGTSRYEWQGMRRLWRYPDIWLLEVVKNMSVLMPPDAPEEARRYVVARCEEAGVRT